jgi:hypothetical protein
MANVEEVLRAAEASPADGQGFPAALKDMDARLAAAAVLDMRALLSAVLSFFACRKAAGAHGYRTRLLLTCFGWVAVRFAYFRGSGAPALFSALGAAADRCTGAARDLVVRCAALCGSSAEGRGMLRRLTGMDVSTSKARAVALAFGAQCLRWQEDAAPDVRSYRERAPREGETPTVRTLFGMLDGTGAPCTKADTAGTEAKDGDGDAGTRQVRVLVFGEYDRLDKHGRPRPIKGSFSYAVSGEPIAEVTGMVRKLGIARGYGTAARMQCVADGEEALEKALRDAFPDALFTNDFMHACEHLHACCEKLGLPAEAAGKEYRFLKGLLYRSGATAVLKRLDARHAAALAASKEAAKEAEYLRKRQDNMRYGWLRKNGYYIGSGHVEAAARILVVRRCKQAGMHWRHLNAVRIAAILAYLRSAA